MTTITTTDLLADPTDADYPQATCPCGRTVIWVHGMWIATDGNAHCATATDASR